MNKPKICILTLGCKVNQYDSDVMFAILEDAGFEVAEGLEPADVYIVNTCAVTAEAERKSRQSTTRIRKLNPDAEIYVCGCASQNNFSQFARDGVEFIAGTERKARLAEELVKKYRPNELPPEKDGFFGKIVANDFSVPKQYEETRAAVSPRARHYVKVQDGCNNFCSYCLVPYLRGRSRSRSLAGVLGEVAQAEASCKEIVVTGINLSAYGRDIGTSLTGLLIALQSTSLRVRLGSLEANVVDREFLDAAKGLEKFCPHFHLSLQSGDDGVLKDMNRRYTTAEFERAAELIREVFPGAAITTDIIVGFPTESDAAFRASVDFARKIGFSDIHVFPYSLRKGTAAARLPVLPPAEVDARQKAMNGVKQELREKYLLEAIGKPAEVLFESKDDGMWCGHTRTYVKVYSLYGARNSLETAVPTALYSDGVRV